MTLCALVKDNVVVEVKDLTDIEQEYLGRQYQNLIDISSLYPAPTAGWLLQGNTLVPYPGWANTSTKITKLAYRQRFTMGEMIGIYTAKASNMILQIIMDNMSISTYVDLLRTETINGTMYLVSLGLITADRANAILTTPPRVDELYTGAAK